MTDQIPPMPDPYVHREVSGLGNACAADAVEELKDYARDLVARLVVKDTELQAVYTALGTTFYMDPPDGGDPGIAVMVGRLKAHKDDLESRLAASQALAGDLAEALEVAMIAMEERRSYVSGGDPSTCWQEMKYGETWDAEDAQVVAALAKFKEAMQ